MSHLNRDPESEISEYESSGNSNESIDEEDELPRYLREAIRRGNAASKKSSKFWCTNLIYPHTPHDETQYFIPQGDLPNFIHNWTAE